MPEQQFNRDQISGLPPSDQVAKDMIAILKSSGMNPRGKQAEEILTQLLPYIVRRDSAVFNHGYQVGRSNS